QRRPVQPAAGAAPPGAPAVAAVPPARPAPGPGYQAAEQAEAVKRRLPPFDPTEIRNGIIWAAILGPPRGVDPGW
ncbi:MAG: hypothetical protein KGM44_06800, partial [bacterium]|nr:hypothetical protein [bacterium]